MKLQILAAVATLAATPALAQSGNMAGMHVAAPAAAAPKTGQGSGKVTSVDAKAGKITLHHGPVAALGWPAMTMTFKAAPQLLQGIKAGQTVTFTAVDGEAPEITAIAAS